ncbi:hypothetical protein AB0K79_34985, partial [Streptomyces sp. NPDC053782]|uniref:hypothetical protein n=1 Tax=Streptomyces sp. NPDC053782 TaxID=3155535 RepID=UPI00344963C1
RSRVVRNPLWASLAGLFGLLGNAASGRVTFGHGATLRVARDGSAVRYGQLRCPRLELLRNSAYRNSLREFLGWLRPRGLEAHPSQLVSDN